MYVLKPKVETIEALINVLMSEATFTFCPFHP